MTLAAYLDATDTSFRGLALHLDALGVPITAARLARIALGTEACPERIARAIAQASDGAVTVHDLGCRAEALRRTA